MLQTNKKGMDIKMNMDNLLINRLKQGDETAIKLFVDKYYADIFRYCRLHIQDRLDAEDLTQDTFERFFKNLDHYKEYGKAMNYLYIIASNGCKDYYKKKKYLLLENIPEIAVETMDYIEIKLDILNAVKTLPEECKEVFLLYYFQGIKLREIAMILDIGLPLVKYRLGRSKKLLKEYLLKE